MISKGAAPMDIALVRTCTFIGCNFYYIGVHNISQLFANLILGNEMG